MSSKLFSVIRRLLPTILVLVCSCVLFGIPAGATDSGSGARYYVPAKHRANKGRSDSAYLQRNKPQERADTAQPTTESSTTPQLTSAPATTEQSSTAVSSSLTPSTSVSPLPGESTTVPPPGEQSTSAPAPSGAPPPATRRTREPRPPTPRYWNKPVYCWECGRNVSKGEPPTCTGNHEGNLVLCKPEIPEDSGYLLYYSGCFILKVTKFSSESSLEYIEVKKGCIRRKHLMPPAKNKMPLMALGDKPSCSEFQYKHGKTQALTVFEYCYCRGTPDPKDPACNRHTIQGFGVEDIEYRKRLAGGKGQLLRCSGLYRIIVTVLIMLFSWDG